MSVAKKIWSRIITRFHIVMWMNTLMLDILRKYVLNSSVVYAMRIEHNRKLSTSAAEKERWDKHLEK